MRYVLLICAAMLVSGPAFADGKGKDKDEHKEQKEKGKSDKGDKDDKGKSSDDHGKSGEKGKSNDDHGKSGEDHGKSGEDHGKSGEGHDEMPSPEGGEDEGAAPVDNLTAQRNELEKHNRRMAKIVRLETLGTEQSAPNLVEKAKMLREKENRRHKKAMDRLKAEAEREEQE